MLENEISVVKSTPLRKEVLVEKSITSIEVSTNLIVFFDGEEEIHRIDLNFFPDFAKGEALTINLKAKMMIGAV